MRIVIDGRGMNWPGIGRYIDRLLGELANLDDQNEYIVLVREDDPDAWVPPGPNFTARVADFRPYRWAEQVVLRRELHELAPDLVHFTHFNMPWAYSGAFVLTVYDLTMLRFASHCDTSLSRRVGHGAKRALARSWMAHGARRATRVTTLSQHTADDLSRAFDVRPERIRVTYAGTDSPTGAGEAVPAVEGGPPFLLYVGSSFPHKNLATLLAAMELLGPENELRLVLAGPQDECAEVFRRRAEASTVGPRVVFAGRVDDHQLTWLYRNASVLVQPSLAEGFGLTGVEAMAHGLPVVAARASCLPEIYGEAASYFDPLDPGALAGAIRTVLRDPARRSALASAGTQRVKRYSWRATAAATLQCYREAVERRAEVAPPCG
ncbi:MAG TPA: hypothetical protein DCQ30_00970 [Acidimicrobiaceae bacterium]|nr:hypothetical protein [Acidimicrobiaceae bacterium]